MVTKLLIIINKRLSRKHGWEPSWFAALGFDKKLIKKIRIVKLGCNIVASYRSTLFWDCYVSKIHQNQFLVLEAWPSGQGRHRQVDWRGPGARAKGRQMVGGSMGTVLGPWEYFQGPNVFLELTPESVAVRPCFFSGSDVTAERWESCFWKQRESH